MTPFVVVAVLVTWGVRPWDIQMVLIIIIPLRFLCFPVHQSSEF